MGKKKSFKSSFGGGEVLIRYYQAGKLYIMVSDDYRDYIAYRVLKPMTKLILFDYLRCVRNKHASVAPDHADKHRFTYSYSECREDVSENTFHRAMRELKRTGWVDVLPETQNFGIGQPVFYTVSDKWRTYKPTEEERQTLNGYDGAKRRRLDANLQRKSAFLDAI